MPQERRQTPDVANVVALRLTGEPAQGHVIDEETLKVDVAGDKAKVGLIGSIACQTSDDAFIRGDVFVRFDANADLDLSTCIAAPVTVRILSTGGRFGTAVEAFKADIQRSVEKAVVEQTRALCR